MIQKNTLIVGGLSGIGSSIKKALLQRGDNVYTASRRSLPTPHHFTVNLPSPINFDRDIEFDYVVFTHRYRGLDWNEEFQVTVKSVDILMKQLQNHMRPQMSVVILGSNAGHIVVGEQSAAYHASRSALNALVKYYAVTLGPKGVRCNSVLPTTIIKPENEAFFSQENEIRRMIERITPLRRMGVASDIADAVEFLCSEKSSFITGQSFFVDGGLSIVGQESIARGYLSDRDGEGSKPQQ